MQKEPSSTLLNVCNFIIKYSIYVLVFLIPIFFLPWTSDVLDFNKQVVLVFLAVLAFFAWMVQTIATKKFSVNMSKVHIFVGVLFLVYLLSTAFSLWGYGSFWGWPQVVSDSLLTMIGLTLFYLLVSNLFNSEKICDLIIILSYSAFLSVIYGFFQVIRLYIFPFSFSKSPVFNTVGNTVGILGFFAIAMLPLFFLSLAEKKPARLILFWAIVFSIGLLVVLNYPVLWWLAAICSVLVIVFQTQKRDYFDSKLLIFPMFFLVVSLFFIILKPTISIIPNSPIEIFLNQKTSLSIALKSLKGNPLFGSGPGTFSYDFLKYKSIDFNDSSLWYLAFSTSASKVLTVLATTGVLGFLAFLALMVYVIYCGIRYFFIDKKHDDSYWTVSINVFISFIVVSVGFFLFSNSVTLDFLYFFLAAAFVALTSRERKEYEVESSSLMSLGAIFIFTLCFVFGFGLLILTGQKYIAEAYYNQGLVQWQNGKSDAGLAEVEKAASYNSGSDLYFRQLSQLYLSKLAQTLNDQTLAKDKKSSNIQLFFSNAINASQMATSINPKNINNWFVRASVYQNFIGLVPGTADWSIKSYDEAIKLDPNNPYYPTQEGIVYLTEVSTLTQDQQSQKPDLLTKAGTQFGKAIQLKPDYAPAIYQMAMMLQMQGKTDEAIKKLVETKQYAPSDIGLAFQLGLLYYQTKDYKNAQGEFERAVGISPNYSNALYFLGLTYFNEGQNDKAITEISKVVQLNPDNKDVKNVLSNLKAGNDPFAGASTSAATPTAATSTTNTTPAPIEQTPQTK